VTSSAVRIEGLCFNYGKAPVLQGVNLTVERGEIFGVVGADGAGKTTLLQIAVGQLFAPGGRVEVLGRNTHDPALRSCLAYMPQGFGLYQDLSVAENLGFFADLHGLARPAAKARIADLLNRTGLAGFEERRAGKLSGGMMQKLALACVLVSDPQVMFLDEPTTGVDPVSRRAFWSLLDGVRAEGLGVVYATANMDEAERCDRVGLLKDGRMVQQGTPVALVSGLDKTLVGVAGAQVRQYRHAVRRLTGVEQVSPVGLRLNVWLGAGLSPERFAQALAVIAPGLEIELLEPTLQDVAMRDLATAEGQRNPHASV
jgi:ABC-2 type transport system ATP-binding protein